MPQEKTLVLDHIRILQKLRRIAYQIYEFNYREEELTIVAIEKKGVFLAERIIPILKDISGFKINLVTLSINKENPKEEPTWNEDASVLNGKSVILIDDVLNSGRTLIYAARHVLDYNVKKLTTVVLVDRRHRLFPIKADFVGLTLSTTLQDHIAVEFQEGNDKVYLE
ncbi:phosphoribosyltransferase family protein [Cryomorphaceae bacterium 1068]|nr:phosphoribosyltransferase family protein [Cryomorphaceae bacterium 1068]